MPLSSQEEKSRVIRAKPSNTVTNNNSYASSDDDDDDEEQDLTPLVTSSTRQGAPATTVAAHAASMSPSIRYSYGSPSLGKRIKIKQRRHHISTRLRWLTNGTALLCVFLFSGIIFGWAPLKLMLQREGQYAGLCHSSMDLDSNNSDGATTNASTVGTTTLCVKQMERYNRIFTSAQFFLSFASLPVGFFLDHASKVTHYLVAAVLEITGLVLVATADYSDPHLTADDLPTLDSFLIGYTLLALAGGMAMMGAFPASFLLPTYQGGLLAAVSCLFDASSVIFAVFCQAHAANPILWSRQHLLLAYAVVAAIVFGTLAACWAKLEHHHWRVVVDKEKEAAQNSNGVNSQADYGAIDGSNDISSDQDTTENTDAVDTHARRIQSLGLHDWTLLQQLCTLDFVVVLVFASVHMLRCNFYIEAVNEILIDVAGPTQEQAAVWYAEVFSFVPPMGIIFVPLIDGTVRYVGIINTLHLTNVIGTVFGALLLIPNLLVQGVNFVVFTGFRAYLYATLNTYVAVTFGVSTMGRVIGCSFTTAAVVTLLQYPAANLAEDVHHGHFFVVNTIFLVIGTLLPVGLAHYYSRVVRIQAKIK